MGMAAARRYILLLRPSGRLAGSTCLRSKKKSTYFFRSTGALRFHGTNGIDELWLRET